MAISDNIREIAEAIQAEVAAKQANPASPTPVGDNLQAKAENAIRGGTAAWVEYMRLFAKTDAELARLIPTDDSAGDPIKQKARAYLVANGMCGTGTGSLIENNVTTKLDLP